MLHEAESGDGACRSIVLRAGVALGESAAVVARRLGLHRQAFEVVLAGGLFQGRNHLLETTLADVLHQEAPRGDAGLAYKPVVGAALEALELARAGPGRSRDRLVASSEGLAVSG